MRVRADSKSYKERGEREEETEAAEQIAMLREKVAWGEKKSQEQSTPKST